VADPEFDEDHAGHALLLHHVLPNVYFPREPPPTTSSGRRASRSQQDFLARLDAKYADGSYLPVPAFSVPASTSTMVAGSEMRLDGIVDLSAGQRLHGLRVAIEPCEVVPR